MVRIHAYKVETSGESLTVAALEQFEPSDTVEYGDGQIGVILEVLDSTFMWPDDDGEEVEASTEEPAYIVARASGGAAPFRGDELTSISSEDAFAEVPDDVSPSDAQDGEAASIYDEYEDPRTAELTIVPGVDDPGIGFDSWPDSWVKADAPARLIALDAWTSMNGQFNCGGGCCMGTLRSKRLCGAFKDSIWQTTLWRGGF